MNAFNFQGLTDEQERLLTLGGWAVDPESPKGIAPSRRGALELVARGLLVAEGTIHIDQLGSYPLTIYRVPEVVFSAWCEHCARLESRDAA